MDTLLLLRGGKKSLKFQDLSLLKRQLIVNSDHAPRDRWRQQSRPARLPVSTTASTGMVANFHLTLLHSTASKSISRANRGVVLSLSRTIHLSSFQYKTRKNHLKHLSSAGASGVPSKKAYTQSGQTQRFEI